MCRVRIRVRVRVRERVGVRVRRWASWYPAALYPYQQTPLPTTSLFPALLSQRSLPISLPCSSTHLSRA